MVGQGGDLCIGQGGAIETHLSEPAVEVVVRAETDAQGGGVGQVEVAGLEGFGVGDDLAVDAEAELAVGADGGDMVPASG